jgi:hypothetical protein
MHGDATPEGFVRDRTRTVKQRRRLRAPLLFVVLLGAMPMTQCLRQDEAECEEAVARLIECCPGFDPAAINCEYVKGDCDQGSVYPSLSAPDSECILGKSCEALNAQKVCDAVIAYNSSEESAHSEHPDVDESVESGVVCH